MAAGQPRAGSAPEPPGSTTLMRVTLLAGPVLSMVDSSVVNVAVPVIVRDLHTSLGTAAWTVSGYLLGLAGGLAVSPWLARRFGTMRAYTAVLLGFTASGFGKFALTGLLALGTPPQIGSSEPSPHARGR